MATDIVHEPSAGTAPLEQAIADRLGQFANFELFVYRTEWLASLEEMRAYAAEHLAYQVELERSGKLFAAGPLIEKGAPRFPPNAGMMVIRAASFEEAEQIADNDPMHRHGLRRYTLQKWIVNEGSLDIKIRLSDQSVSFS